jgi:hypothetical protein
VRKVAALLGAATVDDRRCTLEVAADGSAADVRSVLGGLDAAGSLDAVFLALTAKELIA